MHIIMAMMIEPIMINDRWLDEPQACFQFFFNASAIVRATIFLVSRFGVQNY